MQIQTTPALEVSAAFMAARTVLVWVVDFVTHERMPVFEVDVTSSAVLVVFVCDLVLDKRLAIPIGQMAIWKGAREGHDWSCFSHCLGVFLCCSKGDRLSGPDESHSRVDKS